MTPDQVKAIEALSAPEILEALGFNQRLFVKGLAAAPERPLEPFRARYLAAIARQHGIAIDDDAGDEAAVIEGLPFHPLADLFPLIEGQEFDDLVDDVRSQGLLEDIVMLNGRILDGRNRYRAAVAAGLFPADVDTSTDWRFVEFSDTGIDGVFPTDVVERGPLAFVLSRNLSRRHLTPSQRAMVAADIATMRQGERTDLSPIGEKSISQGDAARALNVGKRSVERAGEVRDRGLRELRDAVRDGRASISGAALIARLPEDQQRALLEAIAQMPDTRKAFAGVAKDLRRQGPQNGQRVEAADSRDYSPTPPWATRALFEHVLPQLGAPAIKSAWDPACGEGHMTAVMQEYVDGRVIGTDIFDYERDGRQPPGWLHVHDFLDPDYPDPDAPPVDLIAMNPPFGDRVLPFMEKALDLAGVGVAIFLQLRYLEGVDRYEAVYRDRPPTLVAPFVERVPLHMGRYEPDGSTMTAFMWLVWIHGEDPLPTFWIPPGCRASLRRDGDDERFTAHPVMPRGEAGK